MSQSNSLFSVRLKKHVLPLKARLLLVATICSFVSVRATYAADQWEFVVAPYLLAPNITGNAGAGRFVNGADVDVDTGDIIDNLDLGGMIHGEARHESGFGIMADYAFMDLSSKTPGPILPNTTIKGDVFQGILEAYGYYRFDLFHDEIDIYGGVRWWHMDVELTRQNAPGPLPSNLIDISEDWVDPVVGARWIAQLGPDWRSSLAADVGGFGVGSDLSLSLQALALYDFSESMSFAFGYRVLTVDYDNGKTGTSDYFSYDTVTHGPMMGLAFRF